MNRIAVLGDMDSIKGFACLGLDIYPCKNYEDSKKEFKKLVAGEYPVIYITENTAKVLKREIEEKEEDIYPIIIPIPGLLGNTGLGIERLKASVERAVGSDIIFNN